MDWFTVTDGDRRIADSMILSGYRATSNRYRIVSRIDRPDWKEAMADYQTGRFPGDPAKNRAQGMAWVNGLGDGAADFYRRCISKDNIEGVSEPVYYLIKKAGNGGGWGNCNEFHELVPVGHAPRALILEDA